MSRCRNATRDHRDSDFVTSAITSGLFCVHLAFECRVLFLSFFVYLGLSGSINLTGSFVVVSL